MNRATRRAKAALQAIGENFSLTGLVYESRYGFTYKLYNVYWEGVTVSKDSPTGRAIRAFDWDSYGGYGRGFRHSNTLSEQTAIMSEKLEAWRANHAEMQRVIDEVIASGACGGMSVRVHDEIQFFGVDASGEPHDKTAYAFATMDGNGHVTMQPSKWPMWDTCTATDTGCRYAPDGPNGEEQCTYCGAAKHSDHNLKRAMTKQPTFKHIDDTGWLYKKD